jgi:undecaprenyl-diphosphatase
VATIPTGVIGVLFEDELEAMFTSATNAAVTMAVTGALLWATRWVRPGDTDEGDMRWWQAALIGLAQGIAIIPGISRSGATIGAALYLGMRREYAGRFSFVLCVPAILGAFALKAGDLSATPSDLIPIAVGTVVAGITGYVALVWLLRVIRAGDVSWFALYLWPVAGLALALGWGR